MNRKSNTHTQEAGLELLEKLGTWTKVLLNHHAIHKKMQRYKSTSTYIGNHLTWCIDTCWVCSKYSTWLRYMFGEQILIPSDYADGDCDCITHVGFLGNVCNLKRLLKDKSHSIQIRLLVAKAAPSYDSICYARRVAPLWPDQVQQWELVACESVNGQWLSKWSSHRALILYILWPA